MAKGVLQPHGQHHTWQPPVPRGSTLPSRAGGGTAAGVAPQGPTAGLAAPARCLWATITPSPSLVCLECLPTPNSASAGGGFRWEPRQDGAIAVMSRRAATPPGAGWQLGETQICKIMFSPATVFILQRGEMACSSSNRRKSQFPT